MFSTMPRIGTLTFSNMAMPLRTTPSEASCGVVTITPPSSGTVWQSESCASPVPGGRSTSRIIQFAPLHRAEELLDGLHDHRPAPDDRLVALQQEAHAHQLHAVVRRAAPSSPRR